MAVPVLSIRTGGWHELPHRYLAPPSVGSDAPGVRLQNDCINIQYDPEKADSIHGPQVPQTYAFGPFDREQSSGFGKAILRAAEKIALGAPYDTFRRPGGQLCGMGMYMADS